MRFLKNRRWPAVVGAVLLPLALVAALVGTMWQANTRTDSVQAAIVNLDEPVTLDGQYVPLGRQLAGKLTSLKDTTATNSGGNYKWVVTNADDAAAGIQSGRYAAVVTIPKNFSAAATSTAGDVEDMKQAVVDVEVSARASAVDPALARSVVQAAIDTLNNDLAKTYLDNVYVGFSTMGEQFATVADAADKLADGTHQLAEGIGQTETGAGQLSAGLSELDKNGSTLADGVRQYTGGVTSLAEGLKKLNEGVSVLPAQTKKLADGAAQSAAGAEDLADGASQSAAGAKELASGASGVATGAAGVSQGVSLTAAGAQKLAGGAAKTSEGMKAYNDGLQQLINNPPAACTLAKIDPASEACTGYVEGLKAALAMQTDPDTGASLADGAAGVAAGAQQLSDGLNKSSGKGVPSLKDAASQVAGGASQLSTGAKQLSTGLGQLSGGAKQLSTGLGQLADGTKQFSAGMSQLSQGVGQATQGAQTLAASGPQLSDGVKQYTDGVHQVADGASQLSTGIGQLSGGASELDKGQRQLADGLKKGASSVPNYTDSEREKLSAVATQPVTTGSDTGPVAFADPATLSAILGIALWLGALLTSTVIGTGAASAWRSSSGSLRVVLRRLLPVAGISVVQGMLFGGAAAVLTSQEPAQFAQLVGLGALGGLAFAAVNQGLALVFGAIGRFVSIAVGLLAVTSSVLSALPSFLTTVRPALPTTALTDGFTSVLGSLPGLGWAVAGLVGWLVLGLVASWAGMARHRQVVPKLAIA